ncbi:hypothetical protein AB0G32_33595 [Streptomyces sp. NPDC023723]
MRVEPREVHDSGLPVFCRRFQDPEALAEVAEIVLRLDGPA